METGTGIVYLKNCRILEGLKEKIVDIIIAGGKITAIAEEFNSI
ncbi:MAG: hypothetical protein ACOCZY_00310 [Bacillota bacterium]